MSDLFNFVSKYDDVIERSRDISKIRLQNFVHHMMDYTHAKLQGSRKCVEQKLQRGANQPPQSSLSIKYPRPDRVRNPKFWFSKSKALQRRKYCQLLSSRKCQLKIESTKG